MSSAFTGLKMADTSKDGLLLGGGIHYLTTTSLQFSRSVEVNKFLLACVILFEDVYFRQYFTCLRERIFNCCKRITVKLKLKFAIE